MSDGTPFLRIAADRIDAPGSARIAGKDAIPRRQRRQLVLNPCLSDYHPHPLYVVCLLGLQARAGAGALRRRSG